MAKMQVVVTVGGKDLAIKIGFFKEPCAQEHAHPVDKDAEEEQHHHDLAKIMEHLQLTKCIQQQELADEQGRQRCRDTELELAGISMDGLVNKKPRHEQASENIPYAPLEPLEKIHRCDAEKKNNQAIDHRIPQLAVIGPPDIGRKIKNNEHGKQKWHKTG
ncbi:hypothetical protein [Sporotomaculum syntrophicum]|uniref:hypothetical protein n=1 Tax=Sporotomaculum syntrophicum TaxID=182264 RepID=UPI00137A3875|nr:hypothetical protein [Sporotomaculum syntrophicum]